MARQLRRATLLAPFILLAGFLALSCFDNGTGPRVFEGRFSLVPQFASSAAEIVTLDRFRVLLRRTADNSVALDTTIAITPGTDSVDLSLAVPMFSTSETFLLTLSLITPAGDTAFQAGPTTVTPSSTGGEPPAIPVTVVYTGVGSHAKSVQILTLNPGVFFGDTVTLAAEALDSNGTPIPLTPIAWASLDTLRARVPNAGQGKAVGVAQRGPARITATLLNGPVDTAAVLVQPKPVRLAVEAGNNQAAPVATALAQPVRFRVKASDSLGVANFPVKFVVVSGGGAVLPDSAITDDSGRVNVQWTLGPTAGAQSIRGRIQVAIPDSVATAGATALAGLPDSLAVNDGNLQTAAVGLAVATAPSVVVRDSLHNPVPGVTVTFQVASGGGSITGATPVTDATGVARVGSWTLGPVAGANTLRAFLVRGPGDTLNVTFSATASGGAAATLQFTTEPANTTVNTAIAAFQVTARDAANNTATGFQGPVSLAFQSNPAGGTLGGTLTVNAVNGVATFNNVNITTVGSRYTLQASAAGVTSATSQQFLITPVGMTHLWTGSADTVLANAANWSATPPGAPSSLTDGVFIPASAPRFPTLDANLAVGAVVVETGASLTVDTTIVLSVVGDLQAGYTSINGPGMIVLAGSGTVAGSVPSLLVTGTYTLSDSVRVSGDLSVSGAGHNLALGGKRVKVLGAFTTAAYGTLTMASNADTLDVAGTTAFAGGNTTGLLTAGVILARGDFIQVGFVHQTGCIDLTPDDTVETFYATGTHRVRLIGTTPQQVGLSTPGGQLEPSTLPQECSPLYAGGSQFANLDIDNAAGVTVVGTVLATGNLSVTNGNVDATGQRVSVAGNVGTSANLAAATLEVGGTLSFGAGSYAVGTSTFLGAAAAVPTALPYQTLRLVGSGTTTWADSLGLTGSLVIGGTVHLQLGHNATASDATVQGSGLLALGGHRLSIPSSGFFQTQGSGAFQMTIAADTLDIGGFAYFQGGSTDGLLTGGTILIGNALYQYGATDARSFRSTGTHVVLNGAAGTQGVYFASPGDVLTSGTYAFGDSRFQTLEVANPSGFFLGSDVYVAGALTMPGGGAITDNSPGHTLRASDITTPSLTAAQVDVAGTLSVGGSYAVGNTIFSGSGQSIPPALPYQSLTVTGTASIATAPSITGDLTVGPSAQLDIGANTLSVPGNVNAGNTIVGTGTIQMTGVGRTLRGTLPNLDVAIGADVTVDSAVTVTGTGTQFIRGHLALALDARPTTMAVPGTLEFSGPQVSINEAQDTLYVGGDLNLYGTATDTTSLSDGVIAVGGTVNEDGQFYALGSGNNKLLFNGAGSGHSIWFFATNGPSQVRHMEVAGSDTVSVGWPFPIAGNLTISGNGVLALGGNTVTVGQDLVTANNGALTMLNPSDALTVSGNATFGGGNTAGRLKAGSLTIRGNFQQGGTDARSFAADSGLITSFTGAAAQGITFANPDTSASHFGDLRVAQPGAAAPAPGVTLNSPVVATGALLVPGDSSGEQKIEGPGNMLTVGGLNVSTLRLGGVPFVWTDFGAFAHSYFSRATSVTFDSSYAASDVQFYVYHSGSLTQFNTGNFVWKTQASGTGRYLKAEEYGGGLYPLIFNLNLLFTNYANLPVPYQDCVTAALGFEAVSGTPGAQILYTCS